jgi:Fic family protein
MSYEPRFTITARLLSLVEEVAVLRERVQGATVELAWVPALQKDCRSRNAHASTAIEGNPLTLEQVRALEAGDESVGVTERSRREVLNYFAGLRHVEQRAKRKGRIRHEDLFRLHRILAKGVMDQGEAGRYRTMKVRVGDYQPPEPGMVSGLMFELLGWWNDAAQAISPVISSSILHYRFEAIHPFADGNGRAGRALALWELYRRGFDTHHVFSVDEYYWEKRPDYYAALQAVRTEGEDLTGWLEYCAEGLRQTLDRVWMRIQALNVKQAGKITLRPRQERILKLLRDQGSLAPAEIWEALGVSRQGAMNLLKPLMEAGLVKKVGSKKMGRYVLCL